MSEPIAFATTRHRCPYCRRSWAHKATAIKHMALCFADPERRTCKTCDHQERGEYGWACELGHEPGPSCPVCGEHPDSPKCPHYNVKPATQLRVLCVDWEAKS